MSNFKQMIKGMRKALLQSKEIQSEAAITLLVLVNGCEVWLLVDRV